MKKESKLKVKEEKITHTCNYCNEEMEMSADFGEKTVPVCTNPECTAYALLQISMEMMPEENAEIGKMKVKNVKNKNK